MNDFYEQQQTMQAVNGVLSAIGGVSKALIAKLANAPKNKAGVIRYLEKDIEFALKQREELKNLRKALKNNVTKMKYTEIQTALESLDNLYRIIPFKETKKIIDDCLHMLIDNEKDAKEAMTKQEAQIEAKRQEAILDHTEEKILALWEGKIEKPYNEWTDEEKELHAKDLAMWKKEFFGIEEATASQELGSLRYAQIEEEETTQSEEEEEEEV